MKQRYYLGLDSTDSLKGGCTTWSMSKIIDKLYSLDQNTIFIDYPKLIRLNPNIIEKTRGNAALSVVFETSLFEDEIFNSVKEIVEKDFLSFRDERSNKIPSIILIKDLSDLPNLYQKSINKYVLIDEIKINHNNFLAYNPNNQAIIGAISAINPKLHDFTYEIILYRTNRNFGSIRKINTESIKKMASQFYDLTFSSFDFTNNRELIAPSGPDPILCGIRGENPSILLEAMKSLVIYEKYDSFTIFKTNQGTNEHVMLKNAKFIPNTVFSHEVTVVSEANEYKGGHIKLKIRIGSNFIDLMIFEPTKNLRDMARLLIPGDKIYLHGSIKNDQHGLYITGEFFLIIQLVNKISKTAPICNNCNKHMTKSGFLKGYKCKTCSNISFMPLCKIETRKLYIGQRVYASPSAQRHLTRPLCRLHRKNIDETQVKLHYNDFRQKN